MMVAAKEISYHQHHCWRLLWEDTGGKGVGAETSSTSLIQSKGTYSQARIKQLISLRSTPEDECKVVKTPGTNSGIRGGSNFLLYYDPKVPYIVTNSQNRINPNHL